MKKKNLYALNLNKKSISQLHGKSVCGGNSNQCTMADSCWFTSFGPYLCKDCDPNSDFCQPN